VDRLEGGTAARSVSLLKRPRFAVPIALKPIVAARRFAGIQRLESLHQLPRLDAEKLTDGLKAETRTRLRFTWLKPAADFFKFFSLDRVQTLPVHPIGSDGLLKDGPQQPVLPIIER
jgi:hypothetical protein